MWFQESNLRKPVRIAMENLEAASKLGREITKNGTAPDAKGREGLTLPLQQPFRARSNQTQRGTLFDDQVEFNFTNESRTFEVYPRCNCGFEAILFRYFRSFEEVWKITCTGIKCPNETSPCRSREEAVRAWTLLIKLTQ